MTAQLSSDLRGDLIENLALFCRHLREAGIRVSASEEIDAGGAILQVDLADPDDFYFALRSTLVRRHADLAPFDRLFRKFWKGEEIVSSESLPRPARRSRPSGEGPPLSWPGEEERSSRFEERQETVQVGSSREAQIRKRSFESLSPEELDEMEALLDKMVWKLATRRSRRRVPAHGGEEVDLRRSFRAALRHGGEFVELARRTRPIERTRLVVLCDVSGSMDSYSRFLIRFLLSVRRFTDSVEIFVFNTTLTHLTPLLKADTIDRLLDEIAEAVPGWSGGTMIGGCLDAFLTGYGSSLLKPESVVVILSDGLDRGETGLLVHAMQGIREKVRKILWLNPLLGDPDYAPLCQGMQAALPFVDHFGAAHNLESLEALIAELAV
ncbi:MAG: VWA domain-containing protein [Candidatus Manganitrophus sp.]|nr:MAG: VWA domain-containing protein [Candidatus Manganitrophus sp.]